MKLKIKLGYMPGDISPTMKAKHLERYPRNIMTKRMHEIRKSKERAVLKRRTQKEINEQNFEKK